MYDAECSKHMYTRTNPTLPRPGCESITPVRAFSLGFLPFFPSWNTLLFYSYIKMQSVNRAPVARPGRPNSEPKLSNAPSLVTKAKAPRRAASTTVGNLQIPSRPFNSFAWGGSSSIVQLQPSPVALSAAAAAAEAVQHLKQQRRPPWNPAVVAVLRLALLPAACMAIHLLPPPRPASAATDPHAPTTSVPDPHTADRGRSHSQKQQRPTKAAVDNGAAGIGGSNTSTIRSTSRSSAGGGRGSTSMSRWISPLADLAAASLTPLSEQQAACGFRSLASLSASPLSFPAGLPPSESSLLGGGTFLEIGVNSGEVPSASAGTAAGGAAALGGLLPSAPSAEALAAAAASAAAAAAAQESPATRLFRVARPSVVNISHSRWEGSRGGTTGCCCYGYGGCHVALCRLSSTSVTANGRGGREGNERVTQQD